MAKLTTNDITSGYATVTALNDNFTRIEAALENTLSRDGTTPNQMNANLDMNGKLILNSGNATQVSGFTWEGPWITALAYQVGDIVENDGAAYMCIVAHTSGTFATDLAAGKWQLFASAALPAQTGNANKFLQTSGSTISWEVPESSEINFIQAGTGAVARTVEDKERDIVNVFDYMTTAMKADVRARTSLVDVTSAWTAALADLTSGGTEAAGDGGMIYAPPGIHLIDNFNPNKHQVNIQGSGKHATVLRGRVTGSGTTVGVITINDVSRGRIADLTLDGNGLKSYCLGICPTNAGAGAGLWDIHNVLMYGATTDTVVLGNATNNPDVASINFYNCAAQGGAFGSSNPSNSQVKIAGSNTLLISWTNGVIGGGQLPINIKISGGDFTCQSIQGINSTSYHVEAAGGQYRSYDEHCEGTGGYLHTLSSDVQGIKSAQHLIHNGQITVTGATTGNKAVFHEAPRQIAIEHTFFNEDVVLGNALGRILVNGNTFGVSNSAGRDGRYNITANGGQIIGIDADAGGLLANGKSLRFVSSDPAVYVGGSSTNAFAQDVLGYMEITVLSASDVNGPNRNGLVMVIRDSSAGGVAFVTYEQNGTPVITSQIGAAFVTAAPGVNEIQVKTRGVGLGPAFRAGTNRNNSKLSISWMACQ